MGGAEVVYLNTIELLRNKGHEVISFSTDGLNGSGADYSIKYSKSVDSRFYSFTAADKMREIVQKEKPDIAHIHNIVGGITYSILPHLRKNNIPVVASIHDYKLLCPVCNFYDRRNNICEKCKGGKYYNCILNNCSSNGIVNSFYLAGESYLRDLMFPYQKLIDHFVFVSDFSRNKFLEVSPELEKKSTRIYNFTQNFEQHNLKGGYFLSFGRLAIEKGIITLISAFRKNGNLKLKIAGEGPLKENIERELPGNVELLGFRSGEELQNLISGASFVLVPSEWYETNSLTSVESYAMGKPVIASRIGALTELVIEGRSGFLFEPKNSIELSAIVSSCSGMNQEEYSALSRQAFNFAKNNFSADVYYDQLIKVYQQVLDK